MIKKESTQKIMINKNKPELRITILNNNYTAEHEKKTPAIISVNLQSSFEI